MLSPARRALVVDVSLGVAAVALASLTRGTPRSPPAALVAGVGLLVLVVTVAVAEHTDVLVFINRRRPMSLVLAAVAFTAVGVAVVVGQGVIAVPSATLLWGMGVGLVGYRVWLGLLNPLPEKRREQAKLWGTPPERDESEPGR